MELRLHFTGRCATEALQVLVDMPAESVDADRRVMGEKVKLHLLRGVGMNPRKDFDMRVSVLPENIPWLERVAGELAYYGDNRQWPTEFRFRFKPFRERSRRILAALTDFDGIERVPDYIGGIKRR